MKQKTKLIVAGAVIGVLAIVVIIVNMGGGSDPDVPREIIEQAVKVSEEAAKTEERVPDPPIQRRGGMTANP